MLAQAIDRWKAKSRRKIATVDEYEAIARQGEFNDLDKAYSKCKPSITDLLQCYLESQFEEFIELE